ncbi:hypothetical protein PISL3812_05354 [Talaromyces islandicus]|uniref:Uncharacterized protein n=1 Tax=Talaromyces islandicus TaxID=28573 RepID=A0A0U1LYB9_TALIS|nr:hypothetical protein PISL3812_05354 [Talaromyces islandicus]
MLATRDIDNQLKVKGFQAYRMALNEMRTAVRDPKRSTGDGLLAAVRMFRFYEIVGFYAHTDGEMALFMNRGCYAKWSDAGRYLLASGRIVSFILGVGRRQRSPFSDIGWVTAPWKDTTKTPLEELTDILVQIPGLLQELDTIRTTSIDKRSSKAWNDLLDRCSGIEEAIVSWRKTIGNDIQTYDYIYSGGPLPIPQVDRDFAVLHLSFFYWSCSILLYTTIHMAATEAGQLTMHYSQIPFSRQGCPNYFDEKNPTLHAHRIIHALPLSYEPHAGGFGQLSSTFPLGLALRYLVVADSFPHEGGSQGSQQEFLQTTLSQPFMVSYSARFVGHLHRFDFFHWNYLVGFVIITIILVVGLIQEPPSVRMTSLPPSLLILQVGSTLVVVGILSKLGVRQPFPVSSTPKGSVFRPGILVIIEDVVAVDGGRGETYRSALMDRYATSVYFQVMIEKLNWFWGFGGMLMGVLMVSILSSVHDQTFAFGLGKVDDSMDLGWCLGGHYYLLGQVCIEERETYLV